jgi:protein translocase SecG subunit
METLLPYAQIILSVLLVILILLQRSAAGLGGAFGGDGFSSGHHTRRGSEKIMFNATVVVSILFGISVLIPLFI